MGAHKYTFFADESGQSGIKKIRSAGGGGASRYMTLGGVLVPNANKVEIRNLMDGLQGEFRRSDLHCSKMNHNQIVRFAKELAKQRVLLFGVISLKETLGSYKDDIDGSDKRYYNKCAQYLLERLGHAMEQLGISENDVSVVFEEGNYDYSALRSLVQKCRAKPLKPATRFLKHVNPYSISTASKSAEQLLQTSDLVAHALFRCVDDGPSTFGVLETRYVDELRPRFHAAKTDKRIVGTGIFPVHKLRDIKATHDVERFLSQLKSRD